MFFSPPVAADSFQLSPWLCAEATVRFYNASKGIDQTEECRVRIALDEDLRSISWKEADESSFIYNELDNKGPSGSQYQPLPTLVTSLKNLNQQEKEFSNHLYQTKRMELFRVKALKLESQVDEPLVDFQIRIGDQLHEKKEIQIEKIQDKFLKKQQVIEDRLVRAQDKLEKEESDVSASKVDTALSFGVALLGSLLGRKKFSLGTAGRAASGIRKAGRIMKEKNEVEQAGELINRLQEDLDQLNQELNDQVDQMTQKFSAENYPVETFNIKPRRSDVFNVRCYLTWEAVPDLSQLMEQE